MLQQKEKGPQLAVSDCFESNDLIGRIGSDALQSGAKVKGNSVSGSSSTVYCYVPEMG